MHVARIVRDRDVVAVLDRRHAREHPALVDPGAGDPLGGQRLGKQAIGCGLQAKRAVSVPVGRPRARNDQDDRRAGGGGWREERALQRGEGSGRLDERLDRRGRGGCAPEQGQRGGEPCTGPAKRCDQIEKLTPQPQLERALGLRTRNSAPASSSTKSISAPFRSASETTSTTTAAPSRSTFRSSASAACTRSNL